MNYLPHTDADRRQMLDVVGVDHMEDLVEVIPASARFPDLDLPQALSELEVERELRQLASANVDCGARPCFLGAGTYRHYIPATVDAVLRRGELYSSYTPYQPELSQGTLQATFEYQSMLCALTAMDVSTASHYDGATALAEAVLGALHSTPKDKTRVLVSPTVSPRYRQVLETYFRGVPETLAGPPGLDSGERDLAALIDEHTAACVLQSPNVFGQLEDVERVGRAAHERGALLVVVPDPISLGLLRPPGELGADLVAAEGQSLGIPTSFGGPHLGILTARQKHLRRLPGRLVGETVDVQGRRGYVLTLGTREQHIRREHAVSNICTNAALMALAAAVYLATVGSRGLRHIASLCYHKSHYAATRLAELPGCRVNPQAPETPFFKEFVLELPVAAAPTNRALLEDHDIIGGYDLGRLDEGRDRQLLLAVTETSTRADIDRLVAALGEVLDG